MVKIEEDKQAIRDRFIIKSIIWAVVLLVLFIFLMSCFTVIGAGNKGVVFSKISGIKPVAMNEGFNLKIPMIETIIPMDVRTLKVERTLASTSQDQQVVSVIVAVNYKADSNSITKLYQEIGQDYVSKVILPSIDESIKMSMAQFKAEDLLNKRGEVSSKALEILRLKLKDRYVIIENLNILNLDFSALYNQAIEQKVTAEQDSFKAQNVLKRIEIEAKQKVTQAQAEADSNLAIATAQAKSKLLIAEAEAKAIQLQNQALAESDKVIELRRIEKWDGTVPQTVLGDSQGMIYNLNNIQTQIK